MGGAAFLLHPFDGIKYPLEIEKNNNICRLKNYDASFYLPDFRKEAIQHGIAITQDFFEIDVLSDLRKNYIKDKAVILDIGANIGNHTVFFAKVCNAKKVYSFEPIPYIYGLLSRNVDINNIKKKVCTYNVALGNSCVKADIENYYEDNMGRTQLKESDNGGIEVVRLDDIVKEIDDIVDFIKIDVEGFEVKVLEGAVDFLRKTNAVIFIECFPNNYSKMNSILLSCGYKEEKEYKNNNYLYKKG